ncbi:unnamed protein product [Calypogeia fissa]
MTVTLFFPDLRRQHEDHNQHWRTCLYKEKARAWESVRGTGTRPGPCTPKRVALPGKIHNADRVDSGNGQPTNRDTDSLVKTGLVCGRRLFSVPIPVPSAAVVSTSRTGYRAGRFPEHRRRKAPGHRLTGTRLRSPSDRASPPACLPHAPWLEKRGLGGARTLGADNRGEFHSGPPTAPRGPTPHHEYLGRVIRIYESFDKSTVRIFLGRQILEDLSEP